MPIHTPKERAKNAAVNAKRLAGKDTTKKVQAATKKKVMDKKKKK